MRSVTDGGKDSSPGSYMVDEDRREIWEHRSQPYI